MEQIYKQWKILLALILWLLLMFITRPVYLPLVSGIFLGLSDTERAAILASVITLVGVGLTLRSNRKSLKEQLVSEAEEREKERHQQLKIQVFSDLIESTAKLNSFLSNYPGENFHCWQVPSEWLISTTKGKIFGTNKTLDVIEKFERELQNIMRVLNEKYLPIYVKEMRCTFLNQLIEAADQERASTQSLIQTLMNADSSNEEYCLKLKGVEKQIAEIRQGFQKEKETLGLELCNEEAFFVFEYREAARKSKIGEIGRDLMLAVRRELNFALDTDQLKIDTDDLNDLFDEEQDEALFIEGARLLNTEYKKFKKSLDELPSFSSVKGLYDI